MPEPLHPLHDRQAQLEHRQVDALAGRLRAWRRNWMTETPAISWGYWKARNMPDLARTSVGQVGDVVALEPDPPAGDHVLRAGQQGVGQRRLAGAVRAHDGVHLAGARRPGRRPAGCRSWPRPAGPGDPRPGTARGTAHAPSLITTTAIVEIPQRPSAAGSPSRGTRAGIVAERLPSRSGSGCGRCAARGRRRRRSRPGSSRNA